MAGRVLPSAVPASWLRVYEPLDAFPAPDRARWTQYALGPDAGADADLVERTFAWRRLLSRSAVLDPVALEAGSLGESGSGWFDAGLEGPGGGLGGGGLGSGPGTRPTTPDTAGTPREAADRRTHAHVLRVSGGVPLICPVPAHDRSLTQAWQLPTEWLLLCRHEDALAGDLAGRYVVAMSRARTRAARVLRTLRRALGEVPVVDKVASTARWLEGFHPRSAVEIDTRSVTALVGEDGLDDVQAGVEALVEGDGPTIAAVYRRIRRREEILREISRAS